MAVRRELATVARKPYRVKWQLWMSVEGLYVVQGVGTLEFRDSRHFEVVLENELTPLAEPRVALPVKSVRRRLADGHFLWMYDRRGTVHSWEEAERWPVGHVRHLPAGGTEVFFGALGQANLFRSVLDLLDLEGIACRRSADGALEVEWHSGAQRRPLQIPGVAGKVVDLALTFRRG